MSECKHSNYYRREGMSEELKCSFYANGDRAVDQKMALELFKTKALIGGLRKELAELRETVAAMQDMINVRERKIAELEALLPEEGK